MPKTQKITIEAENIFTKITKNQVKLLGRLPTRTKTISIITHFTKKKKTFLTVGWADL